MHSKFSKFTSLISLFPVFFCLQVYEDFLKKMKSLYPREEAIKDGEFGAYMEVALVNDGYVNHIENNTQCTTNTTRHTRPQYIHALSVICPLRAYSYALFVVVAHFSL